MKKYKVIIPEEEYTVVQFLQDEQEGIASINASLISFEPKKVFRWHLSIMIELDSVKKNGLPRREETLIIDDFEDVLDEAIKGSIEQKPNSLFLARIAWNGTIELIWRLANPEENNVYLQNVLKEKSYPRPFDYRIDDDPAWGLAEWHLESASH